MHSAICLKVEAGASYIPVKFAVTAIFESKIPPVQKTEEEKIAAANKQKSFDALNALIGASHLVNDSEFFFLKSYVSWI